MGATITLTVEEFLQDFPEFVNKEVNVLNSFITQAGCYVSTNNVGVLRNDCRKLAIELMVGHLVTIQDRMNNGQTATGQVASTSIDAVSVSLVAPPNKDQYEYWLNLTPYGQRLLALYMAKAPAGLYMVGSYQRVLR